MNRVRIKIRKYPVATTFIVCIWVLCFISVPESPLSEISMIDKWTHIVMYLGTCMTIWAEYWRNHHKEWAAGNGPRWGRMIVGAWLLPVVMSGIIEVLQENCTGGNRSGEWMDFAANTLGCTLAMVCYMLFHCLKHSLDNHRA